MFRIREVTAVAALLAAVPTSARAQQHSLPGARPIRQINKVMGLGLIKSPEVAANDIAKIVDRTRLPQRIRAAFKRTAKRATEPGRYGYASQYMGSRATNDASITRYKAVFDVQHWRATGQSGPGAAGLRHDALLVADAAGNGGYFRGQMVSRQTYAPGQPGGRATERTTWITPLDPNKTRGRDGLLGQAAALREVKMVTIPWARGRPKGHGTVRLHKVFLIGQDGRPLSREQKTSSGQTVRQLVELTPRQALDYRDRFGLGD